MNKIRNIFTILILIIQSMFLSSSSNDQILRSNHYNINKFINNFAYEGDNIIVSHLKLPQIPPRPTINELSEALQNVPNGNELNLPIDKVKNFMNKGYDAMSASVLKQSHDRLTEASFNIASEELFSLTLEAIMSLNLKLKKLDIVNKTITVTDKFKNKIVVSFVSVNKRCLVKIKGYHSLVGRLILKGTMDDLLSEIQELSGDVT